MAAGKRYNARSIVVIIVLLMLYCSAITLWSKYDVNWPRWILVLGILAGVVLSHRLPRPVKAAWLSVVSVALLATSLCLDIWTTHFFLSKGQYAGSYIGIGILRLLAFALAFTGIVFFPTYIWSDQPSSERMSKNTKRVFGAFGGFVLIVILWATGRSCIAISDHPAPHNKVHADFADIPGEYVGTDNEIGSCVKLAGKSIDDPVAKTVPCASPEANYRIIQIAARSNECVSDADQRYYSRTGTVETTYCLDYNWSSTDCIKMADGSGWHAVKVRCDDVESYPIEKPFSVILETASLAQCPNGGWDHPKRKFTVCTTTLNIRSR